MKTSDILKANLDSIKLPDAFYNELAQQIDNNYASKEVTKDDILIILKSFCTYGPKGNLSGFYIDKAARAINLLYKP